MDDETRKKLQAWNDDVGRPFSEKPEPVNTSRQKEDSAFFNPLTQQNSSDAMPLPSIDVPFSEGPPLRAHPATLRSPLRAPKQIKNPNVPNPIAESLAQKARKDKEVLSRIRTYETDAAEAINQKKVSLSSMVIAEKKANAIKQKSSTTPTNSKRSAIIYTILSILLIAGGGGILYAWYKISHSPEEPTEIAEEADLIINPKESREVLFEFSGRETLVRFLERSLEENLSHKDEIVALKFIKEVSTTEGEAIHEPVSAREFLETLEVNVPISFYRSLEDDFLYAMHKTSSGVQPLLILTTDFYQNAFASMLSWETFLVDDLSFMALEANLPQEEAGSTSLAGTSAFSSESETQEEESVLIPTFDPSFKDRIIKNQDVRILVSQSGKPILLYSFIKENAVVLTNNIGTFEEVLRLMTVIEFK